MATTAKPTAAETYRAHQADIATLLDCLRQELERHAARQTQEPRNWGLAGDLGHVRHELKELLVFAMGRRDPAAAERQVEEHLAELRENR